MLGDNCSLTKLLLDCDGMGLGEVVLATISECSTVEVNE